MTGPKSEPQNGAARLEMQIASRMDDASSLRLFGSLAALALAAIATINVLVDPFGYWGVGFIEPVVWVDRDEKARKWMALATKPELVVLGSSRSMKLAPSCLTQVTGLPAFNFGVNSARVEDFQAILAFLQSKGAPPTEIVLGLDPESLHPADAVDKRLKLSRELGPFAADEAVDLGGLLFGGQTLKASMRAAKQLLIEGPPKRESYFEADGYLVYSRWEAEQREGRFDRDLLLKKGMASYRGRYAGFIRLSPRRLSALHSLLEQAHARGVLVRVFIPPLDPALVSALADTTLQDRTADLVQLLSRWETEGIIKFARTETVEAFGGLTDGFFDGAHMTAPNTERVIKTMFGRDCAVQ